MPGLFPCEEGGHTVNELVPTSTSDLDAYMRQAEMLAASTLVPAQYRNKPADILVASLAGREVGMGPWASLTYVVVIQGKATINAEGRVALIRKAGHSISGESTPERAVAHGKRRDTGDEMTVEWTIDMAKRAGLANQSSWKNYPEAMLWARAVSQLSRMLFADVLMGVSYDPEELGVQVGPEGEVIEAEVLAPANTEPLADDGTHEGLRLMLRALPAEIQKQVTEWMTKNGVPFFGEHDRLTVSQATALNDEIERLDPPPAKVAPSEAVQQEEPTVPGPEAPPAPTQPLTAAERAAARGTKKALGAVKNAPVADEDVQDHFPGSEVVAS